VVRSYLPTSGGSDLVDVGAGAGLLGDYLVRDRPEGRYAFVEPITSLRDALASAHGASADLTDAASFGNASAVTLLDVLEHQHDDRAFLAALVAKMAPGSSLLLTVPAMPRLWSGWDVALGHERRYTKPTLRSCTEDLPLRVDELNYLFPEMVPLGLWRARRGAADGAHVPTSDDAEFPDLPRRLNDALAAAGTVSLALRRWWPCGTSLFLAATITP
jgi:hypothetical protein